MMRHRFWQLIHNCIAHPIEGIAVLIIGRSPNWVDDFHDWTAYKAWGSDV